MPFPTQGNSRFTLDPSGPPSRVQVSSARHLASIRSLCEELGRPFEEIAALYHSELTRLLACATVLDYLPVLAVKHVREQVRHRCAALGQDDSSGAHGCAVH